MSENFSLKLPIAMRKNHEFQSSDAIYRKVATTKDGIGIFCMTINSSETKENNRNLEQPKFCHDSQELLRNISNFLQMIKMQLAPDCDKEVVNYIDFALNNTEILSKWNKKLLNESEYYSNHTFKLYDAIDHIRRLIYFLIADKECVIQCEPDIPSIRGNYFEILRVFKNLIENSIKYAKTDKLIIDIAIVEIADDFIRIMFRDNGSALSETTKNEIESILSGEKNSLGLEICRDILSCNNGMIKFLRNGSGCTYEIKLHIGTQKGGKL
jgi:light-regulated signal transduction histidine kinase (bacteriophytochrome)